MIQNPPPGLIMDYIVFDLKATCWERRVLMVDKEIVEICSRSGR